MFEKITLRRSHLGAALTAGELAEALLFYQNVHIVLDHGSLTGLIRGLGIPTLLTVLNRPGVTAVYCEEMLGVHTTSAVPFNKHMFIAFGISGHESIGTLPTRKKRLQYIVESQGIEKNAAKSFVERFLQKAPIKSLSSNYYVEGGVVKAALDDLNDSIYTHEAINISLRDKLHRPAGSFEFKIIKDGGSFYVASDLNYSALNQEAKKIDPTAEITEAHLVVTLLDARSDIILAGHYGSEFYTGRNTSDIIRLKYKSLLKRLEIESDERSNFMDIIADGKSLQEVINSGERSFSEFLTLLDKSDRFREWAQKTNPDEKLVKAYFEDINRKGWMESLPAKGLRYVLGIGAGLINPPAGLAFSAADTFLLDKIKLGWKPSHFVNGRLKEFIRSE